MYNIDELNAMSDSDLKSLAQSMGIKKVESLNKENLVYQVLDQQAIIDAANNPEKPKRKRTRTQKDSTAKKANKEADSAPAEDKKTEDKKVEDKKSEDKKAEQEPAEEPKALLKEMDAMLSELEDLMTRINLTNSKTVVNGKTLTEMA